MDLEKLSKWPIFIHVRNWYGKFERPISSLSLIGGFVFDAVTLQRIDLFWDNFWVIAHLAIVGTCIVFINRIDLQLGDEKNPAKFHFWLVNILQFFFGGLLSTYLVFYFRSSDIFVEWPFILILVVAFWANESFKRAYVRLSFQIILYYLSIFAFAIFFIPVLVHEIGPAVFLLSGIASLAAMTGFMAIVSHFSRGKIAKKREIIVLWVGIVFALVNILYFNNLIPPIPFSLKDSGVYHAITKNADGNYTVLSEDTSWWTKFFTLYPDFHASESDPIYVYSAIFSPALFETDVIDDWQYYDDIEHAWVDKYQVSLAVTGGRDGGFRTWSVQQGIMAGRWRVNIKTQTGQIIGTIRFNILPQTGGIPLTTEVKD